MQTMRTLALILLLLVGCRQPLAAAIAPESVAVLYNSAVPESRKLADVYRIARGIPVENLIALEMPISADISREEYDKSIRKPLRREFQSRSWWRLKADGGGVTLPSVNRIRVLVTMRGVPLRIKAMPKAAGATSISKDVTVGHDEASVDSELAMFAVEGLPIDGVLQNKYYKSEKSIAQANLPFLVLTARIDAPTYATCERMIQDALEVEKTGLWGRSYVDIANKYPQGDQWLEVVAKGNDTAGIPTVVDRFNDTLPTNYPMTDAALYYGWYDANVSGPFLNGRFQFRKGAVAAHLHSFSAQQLTDPTKNWSGALLEKGAAATIGNVYEPYLHMTHDFGILHQRLLAGFTWGEACWMAMPVTSWQAVVLGDPLYCPYRHLDGSGVRRDDDIDFRALRAAAIQWQKDPVERQKQLEQAAQRTRSGTLAEAVGLGLLQRGDTPGAAQWFRTAKGVFIKLEEKLRQDFHLIAIDRVAKRKDLTIQGLQDAQLHYGAIPEAEGLKKWLDIVNPPPPPVSVDPAKVSTVKKP